MPKPWKFRIENPQVAEEMHWSYELRTRLHAEEHFEDSDFIAPMEWDEYDELERFYSGDGDR